MFFLPIALLSLDLITVVLTNQMNDHLAKDAARAAANQQDAVHARLAAQKTIDNFLNSPVVRKVELKPGNVNFDGVNGQVAVELSMSVALPVPFPGFDSAKFTARSIEPIVGTPAAL